jgi:hypothetical protein
MYKEKYLNKNKYLDQCQNNLISKDNNNKDTIKNQNGGAPEFTSIDANTNLFRCAPDIASLRTYQGRLANVRQCSDTGKTGLYFANRVIISLAMCIEYNKLMEFAIFRPTSDIDGIIKGKYSFRDINPERYYNEDGGIIPYVYPSPDENVSHMECNLQLLASNDTFLLPNHIQAGLDCLGSCEVFLSTLNPSHLQNLELVAAFRFNPATVRTAGDLHRYMIQNHFPFVLQKYIDDGILIQFM